MSQLSQMENAMSKQVKLVKSNKNKNLNKNKQKKGKHFYGQIGKAIGSFIPFPGAKNFGKKIGQKFGPFLKKVTGVGDYKIHANNLVKNSLMKGSQPMVFNGKQTVVIRHREYITDVISGSAGTFNYQVYQVNPGNHSTFPWLSTLASNFESYKFKGIIFEYKSMSAAALNSTNTALGQIILSCQYDAGNTPFTDKINQEQYENSISIKPADSVIFGVECKSQANVLNKLYIDSVSLPAGTPIQMINLCQFQISTNGMQGSNVNCGELWVTYEVELLHVKPTMGLDQMISLTDQSSLTLNYLFKNPITYSIASGIVITYSAGARVALSKIVPGRYMISHTGYGSVSSGVTGHAVTGTTVATYFGKTATSVYLSTSNTTYYSFFCDLYFPNVTVEFTGFTGTLTYSDFFIAQVPSGFTSAMEFLYANKNNNNNIIQNQIQQDNKMLNDITILQEQFKNLTTRHTKSRSSRNDDDSIISNYRQ